MSPALSGIVVGYWSEDGKPPNKLNEGHHNVFAYDEDEDSCALQSALIKVFSHDGNTVVDATGSSKFM